MAVPLAWLLMLSVPAQSDTVRLSADSAIRRAVAAAPRVAAAQAREAAAVAGIGQARAWRNPSFTISAENIGATHQITGRYGLPGIEGQALLTEHLPVGGDRGSAIAEASALSGAATASTALTGAMVRFQAVRSIALAERDGTVAHHAADELRSLDRFARDVALRSTEGHAAGGEAARATIEAALAATRAARREAEAVVSQVELARVLGLPLRTRVVVQPPRCAPVQIELGKLPTELDVADWQVRAAEAGLSLAKAHAIPDVLPQIGWRRSAGVSGLFLGLAFDLPLLNTGRAAVRVAEAQAQSAAAERAEVSARLTADLVAAERSLVVLDSVGTRFSPEWAAALDRALTAAQARYDAGEGTLAELLDARRARLSALDDFEAWRAERRMARAQRARLAGSAINGTSLCDDPMEGNTR